MKVQIQCDVSETGMGAYLLLEGQPIAYYSKALTPSEMNWFPIEKECLAVVCAGREMSAISLLATGRSEVRPQAVGNEH